MATREEMIAASKKRFGESWEPLDLSTEESAKRTYGDYWDTSCYNPKAGCSVHNAEVDRLTAIYDKAFRTPASQGGVLADDASNQEFMREKVDKAEITRRYAEAREAALVKWEAVAAPDQMRTVSLCREINNGWFEHAQYLDGQAAEIDAGMKSGRFKTKKAGMLAGGGPMGGLPKPVLYMILIACAAGIAFVGSSRGGGGGGGYGYSQGR
jgi:hypothetical protein